MKLNWLLEQGATPERVAQFVERGASLESESSTDERINCWLACGRSEWNVSIPRGDPHAFDVALGVVVDAIDTNRREGK